VTDFAGISFNASYLAWPEPLPGISKQYSHLTVLFDVFIILNVTLQSSVEELEKLKKSAERKRHLIAG